MARQFLVTSIFYNILDGNTVSCNFDIGYCGWTQMRTDQFDWSRKKGSTSSSRTGPTRDHTSGSKYLSACLFHNAS
jgi:hypothetical protein